MKNFLKLLNSCATFVVFAMAFAQLAKLLQDINSYFHILKL